MQDCSRVQSADSNHWYSGDHFETVRVIKEQYPELKILTSEACIEYSKFSYDAVLQNAQKYAHDIPVYIRLNNQCVEYNL